MIMLFKEINTLLILVVLTLTIQSCKENKSASKDEQTVFESEKLSDWPEELDAMHAAPENHKILLENEKVRVLEVTVLPKETEALHHHQWPSVLHIMETGDFIRRDGDGNVIADSRKFKKQPALPITIWKEPQKAHSVENLSDSITMKIIRVELKQ